MASDIWLRTIPIVRKETRCRHIGYSIRLTARVMLYAPSHRQDSTYHGLCYTSRGTLAGTRNNSINPPHEGSIRRPLAPWANALTTELHLALPDGWCHWVQRMGWTGCYDTGRNWFQSACVTHNLPKCWPTSRKWSSDTTLYWSSGQIWNCSIFFFVVTETIFCNTTTLVHTPSGLHKRSYSNTSSSSSCHGHLLAPIWTPMKMFGMRYWDISTKCASNQICSRRNMTHGPTSPEEPETVWSNPWTTGAGHTTYWLYQIRWLK